MNVASPLPAVVAPPANAAAAADAPSSGEPSAFSKLLASQKRPAQAAKGNHETKAQNPESAAEAGTPAQRAGRRGQDTARADEPPVPAGGAEVRVDAAAALVAPPTSPEAESQAAAADTGAPVDPALAGMFAAIKRAPTSAPATADETADAARAIAHGDVAATASQKSQAGVRALGAHAPRNGAGEDTSAAPNTPLGPDTTASRPSLEIGAPQPSAGPSLDNPALQPVPSAGPASPVAIAALQTAPPADAAPAATSVSLPTRVDSPEFREALGVQVSVLVRDGVQQATLQLNPAEMGPVSVQIALDGTRAQVDFGAERLATRQIIESGLPELAAALRDAGFTLAGGGVSQHSRGQDERGRADGGSAPHAPGEALDDKAATPPRRVAARVAPGGLDLYA